MKHKVFRFGSAALAAQLLAGGVIFLGGCQVFEGEEEPMPQGAYKPAASPDRGQAPVAAPVVDVKGTDPVLVTTPLEPVKDVPPVIEPVVPPAPSSGKKAPAAAAKSTPSVYTVQKGDSYWKIARKHGVSVQALLAANQADVSKPLAVGRKLVIPDGKTASSAKPAAQTAVKPAKSAAKTAAKPAKIPADGKYTIRKGDSFYKIAHRFGVRASEIAAANNMKLTDPLYEGKTLMIPKPGAKSAVSAKAAPKGKKPAAAADAGALPEAPVPPSASPSAPAAPAAEPAAPAAPAVEPAAPAAPAAEPSAPAAPAAEPAAPAAVAGYSCKVDRDMTIEDITKEFQCTQEEIRALNPSFPATGVIKAGTTIQLP